MYFNAPCKAFRLAFNLMMLCKQTWLVLPKERETRGDLEPRVEFVSKYLNTQKSSIKKQSLRKNVLKNQTLSLSWHSVCLQPKYLMNLSSIPSQIRNVYM